jgi:hypothetical protein
MIAKGSLAAAAGAGVDFVLAGVARLSICSVAPVPGASLLPWRFFLHGHDQSVDRPVQCHSSGRDQDGHATRRLGELIIVTWSQVRLLDPCQLQLPFL